MNKIKYIKGDATKPQSNTEITLIIHCCNNIGAWGAGFVLALSKRDKTPEIMFGKWRRGDIDSANGSDYLLGNVQFCPFTNEKTFVANMIGQNGVGSSRNGIPPIRYDAINNCLIRVANWCLEQKENGKTVSIHAPKFGAGLAGGEWSRIEKLIEEQLIENNIEKVSYWVRLPTKEGGTALFV